MLGCFNPILDQIWANPAIEFEFVHILPKIGLKQPSIFWSAHCKCHDYSNMLILQLKKHLLLLLCQSRKLLNICGWTKWNIFVSQDFLMNWKSSSYVCLWNTLIHTHTHTNTIIIIVNCKLFIIVIIIFHVALIKNPKCTGN